MNPPPAVYKTAALPTELRQQITLFYLEKFAKSFEDATMKFYITIKKWIKYSKFYTHCKEWNIKGIHTGSAAPGVYDGRQIW